MPAAPAGGSGAWFFACSLLWTDCAWLALVSGADQALVLTLPKTKALDRKTAMNLRDIGAPLQRIAT
jgi:hypothetical protein